MNSIYLVLDMINDLVHADGPNGKSPMGQQVRERNVIENTARALSKARAAGVPVGYVRVGFSPDYKECPPRSPIFSKARENGLFKLGSWGTAVHEALLPMAADFDIVKHRVSSFYGTDLEPILRAHSIHRIYVSGVSTTAVVQATIREALDRDYECFVIEDGCSSAAAEDHQASITMLTRFSTIVDSNSLEF